VSHDETVFLRGQPLGLPQYLVRDTELADIIYKGRVDQKIDVIVGQSKPCAKNSGDKSRVETVGMGHVILAGEHVIQIVQKKLTALGAYNDVAIYFHELLEIDWSSVGNSADNEILVNGKIDFISGFKIAEAFTQAYFLEVCGCKVYFFFDGNNHDGLSGKLLNDCVSDLGVGCDDDLVLVIEDIVGSYHAGLKFHSSNNLHKQASGNEVQ
jgi:hypothetical protein